MDDLAGRKAALRLEMQTRRAALDPEAAALAAARACEHLVRLVTSSGHRRVALFAAMRREIDPTPAFRALRAAGVSLAYPRVPPRGTGRRLGFHEVEDLTVLRPGILGILEPPLELPVLEASELDLVVTPGLAFDRRGGRLGWGGGYYDATLGGSGAISAGFCFELQLVDAVPRGPADHAVDHLITEAGARRAD